MSANNGNKRRYRLDDVTVTAEITELSATERTNLLVDNSLLTEGEANDLVTEDTDTDNRPGNKGEKPPKLRGPNERGTN